MPASGPPPIVVEQVHKRFQIPREQVSTLKELALHPLKRRKTDALHALKGVSFEVADGEFFGIVGRNGSGKSTLLKCLAGIYGLDSGAIYVNGRMSTFIELGVGFNPDLPARDNVLLNATMLGLSPREAKRRFDSVIDFAELGSFIDLKIKNYSSGMLVRLAFSVMIHVDADILLIDEVLAVGDAAFQQKCYDVFERIHSGGGTVLFVTHDMSAVRRFCDRALLLEHGRPVELGDPESVGSRYLELNFSEQAREAEELVAQAETEQAAAEGQPAERSRKARAGSARSSDTPGSVAAVDGDHAAGSTLAAGGRPGRQGGDAASQAQHREAGAEEQQRHQRRYGDGGAEILEAWFEDEHRARADVLQTGRRCAFAAKVRFKQKVEDPLFGINIHNSRHDHLLSASNLWSDAKAGAFEDGDEVTFKISFENVLSPDRYSVTPAVARQSGAWIERCENMLSVIVTGTRESDALLELPYEVAIERARDTPAAELTL